MRFLSEDIRILLQGVRRKRQPGDGACRMVFEQVVLVGLEQETAPRSSRFRKNSFQSGCSSSLAPDGWCCLR